MKDSASEAKKSMLFMLMLFISFMLVVYIVWFVATDYITQLRNDLPPESIPPENMYGCPGCPANFSDFAKDMCHRMGPTFTVTDGTNTMSCKEVLP